MKIFMILPFVYLGGSAYLYWRTMQTIAVLPVWAKVIISLIFWKAAFSLFLSIGLRNTDIPAFLSKTMFVTGSVWMAFLLYMVLALLVLDLARLCFPAIGNPYPYALALTVIVLAAGYINYRHPRIEQMEMTVNHDFEGDGLKIVAASDIHLGYGTGSKALRRYVDMINAQNPDVILIAGDLIDNSTKPLYTEPFAEELARLEAPVYMVPGNHEYISGIEESASFISGTGITMLRDSIVSLPCGVQLVGRDDKSNRDRASLEELMQKTDPQRPVIVLDHQPYALSDVARLGADIQFSGHTHSGQIWPLNLFTRILFDQDHGYRKWDNTHVWVSSGLSLWGPPFRIGTDSDLAVVTVRPSRP